MTKLTHVNLVANKITPYVLPDFLKFVNEYQSREKCLILDITQKDLRPKEREEFVTKLKSVIKEKVSFIKGKLKVNIN